MMSLHALRRLGPWLLGLFVAAQIAGVVPLISIHIQHTLESERAISEDLATLGVVDYQHERGATITMVLKISTITAAHCTITLPASCHSPTM